MFSRLPEIKDARSRHWYIGRSTVSGSGSYLRSLNATAGGDSLVSFPALLVAKYLPLLANVTNNIGASPYYLLASDLSSVLKYPSRL